MILLQQMLAMLIFMLIGYTLRKSGHLDQSGMNSLSFIIVNIGNPCMLISGAISRAEAPSGRMLLLTVILCFFVYGFTILCGLFVPRLLGTEPEDRGVYRVMLIFSNIGFMGFPLIRAMYGAEALLYASLFTIPFNFLIYTYGSSILQPKGSEKKKIRAGNMINIGTIACAVTLFLSFVKLPVPEFLVTSVDSLGALPTSLSMLVIGASMTEFPIRELFTDVRLLGFSFIKMLVIPIAGMLIIRLFVHDPVLVGVSMVMLATPVGSLVAMIAQQNGADYTLASKGIALTTLLSIATMPLVSLVIEI